MRVLVLSICCAVLWACVQIWWQWPSSFVEVVTCDVGQGDAILVKAGFWQQLIDGGPDESSLAACFGQFVPWWDISIEQVVISHPDADHIGGLSDIASSKQVGIWIVPNIAKDSELFKSLHQSILQSESDLVLAEKGMTWCDLSQNCQVVIASYSLVDPNIWQQPLTETLLSAAIAAQEKSGVSANDGSIVILGGIDNATYLLMGDAEQQTEQALIDVGLLGKVNLLKVGHHGAKTSTSAQFVEIIRPEFSVLSLGRNNKYGHPHLEVIDTLTQVGTQIYRTDLLGSIVWRLEEESTSITSSR